jgi:hypothetical protein
MRHNTSKNDGMKARSQVVNIGVIPRSMSLKGGSRGSIKENLSNRSSSHGEKWIVGEIEAL